MDNLMYLGMGYLAACLGVGGVVFAAAWSIARVVSAAVEGTARQPEAAAQIKSNMQLFIFLIEGLGIVGLLVPLLMVLKSPPAPTAAGTPAAAVSSAH